VQDGVLKYVNPAWEGLHEMSAAEALGCTAKDFIHPDFLDDVKKAGDDCLLGRTVKFRHEVKLRTKTGKTRWLDATVTAFEYEGRPALLGSVIDVTERKRAEEALRDSESLLRAQFENSPDMVFTVDRRLRFVSVNRVFTGPVSARELVGRDVIEVLPPEGREEARKRIQACFDTREMQEFEHEIAKGKWVHSRVVSLGSDAMPERVMVIATDITARKLAQKALGESEERLRLLFELSQDAIFVADADSGILVGCNMAAAKLVGREASEVVGEHQTVLHPADETGKYRELFRKHSAAVPGRVTEMELLHRDGRRIPVELSSSLVEIGGRKFAQGVFHDITERKKAEQALRQSELQYRTTLESMGDSIHVVDREMRITLFNSTFTRWNKELGLMSDVLGCNVFEVYPFLPQSVRDEYAKAFSTGEFLVTEDRTKVGDREFVTETRKIPVFEGGTVVRVVTVVRDVTAKKRAEDALRESELKYRTFFDEAGDGIMLMSMDGTRVTVNESFAKIHGYASPREMEHLRLQDLDTPESAMRAPERLRRLALGERINFEVEHYHRDGHVFPLSVTCNLVTFGGEQYYLGFHRDITDRKLAEEALLRAHTELEDKVAERTRELTEANAKLTELDRMKSEFLATMSHELRTPLNSIIGFTGMVLQGVAGGINEEQKKQLGMVYGSSKHLLNLINDILDLSRIESGKMDFDYTTFRIDDLADDVVRILSPIAAPKGVVFGVDIGDGVPDVTSDRKRLMQILLNLAGNAVKFTDKGEVRIICRRKDGLLRVCVSDTGIGIRPENMAMLFEAFRQVDGTAQRRYEGAGLGLYLCRKLVTLLGGRIWAESEFGRGSKFWVELPLKAGKGGRE
jgi:PAS domain S-box-containing protein